MDTVRQIYKRNGNLHHAYLLIGTSEILHNALEDFLVNDLSFSVLGNPDFLDLKYNVFGIDEARLLKVRTAMRVIDEMRIVILSFNSITTEAQNSLLKIFEDGPSNTVFFVIAETPEIFIPTLLSRFFISDVRGSREAGLGGKSTIFYEDLIKKFLVSTPANRFLLLADLIEKKDKTETVNFLNVLENFLHKKFSSELKNVNKKENMDKKIVNACEEILNCKSFLYDRSPSVKMILEHTSCIMPVLEN